MNRRLAGRYQIIRQLGGGGMGDVYQAVDVETGNAVAAKIMRPTAEDPLNALLRFQQEGAVLSTLNHPNIVRVLGTFLDGDTACIIMEFLEGRDLSQILHTDDLPLERVKTIGLQTADALAYAHVKGIIHRDIKPDNVIVMGNDHVKVADFGIARILRPGTVLNTATGISIGTPIYMAPEQIEGQPVDARSDVYSLGVVLYHMVTGRPPFQGESVLSIAYKQVHEAPVPPRDIIPDLPEGWQSLILKALAKHAADRFQTAAALGEDLATLDTEPATIVTAPVDVTAATTRSPGRGEEETVDLVEPARAQSVPPVRPVAADSRAPSVADPPPPAATAAPADDLGSTAVRPRSPMPEPAAPIELTVPPAPAGESSAAVTGVRKAPSPLPVSVPAPEAAPAAVSPAENVTEAKPPHGPEVRRTSRPAWLLPVGVVAVVLLAVIALFARGALSSSKGHSATAPKDVHWFSVSVNNPSDLTVDGSGDVYVADTGNGRVLKLSPSGKILMTLGKGGSGNALSSPSGIAVDSQGNIYVSETGKGKVVEYTGAGSLIRTWSGTSSGRLHKPLGVALGAQGNLYVADAGANEIQHLSSEGTWQTPYVGFKSPTAVTVDPRADIFVADTGHNAVEEMAWSTDLLHQTAKGQVSAPRDVAVDAQGDVYIADTGNNRIVELAPNFTVVKTWKGFNQPSAVTVDSQGHIYVADAGDNRVGRLTSTG